MLFVVNLPDFQFSAWRSGFHESIRLHSARSGRETFPPRALRVLAGSDIRVHSRVLPALLRLKTKEKDNSQSIRHSLFSPSLILMEKSQTFPRCMQFFNAWIAFSSCHTVLDDEDEESVITTGSIVTVTVTVKRRNLAVSVRVLIFIIYK